MAVLHGAGCVSGRPTAPLPADAACIVVDDAAHGRVTVAVTELMRTRTVGAQFHDTLVRIDCSDALVPGLASEWSGTGLEWRFRIAPGATFSDGTPVTAVAVVRAWSTSGAGAMFDLVAAHTEYDLVVHLRSPADARLFALPALAVSPPGSGPFTVDTSDPAPAAAAASASAAAVTRLIARVPDARTPNVLEVSTLAGDARVAIDAGVDAIVTGDAATLAYARERSDYSLVPLTWNRTYVVLAAALPSGALREAVVPAPVDVDAFARGAIHADVRSARSPHWSQECADAMATSSTDRIAPDARVAPDAQDAGGARGRPGARDVVYPRGDDIARDIAERITALAWPREQTPSWLSRLLPADYAAPRTVAVSADDLTGAVRSATTLAVIAPFPRVGYGTCNPDLVGTEAPHLGLLVDGWAAVPLLDARDHLVHRTGIGRVRVDGSGTIRFGTR